MDTKQLHDLLIEDGFNLKNYDHSEWEDAAGVWTEYCMTQPSWLMDFWLDALAELHDAKRVEPLHRLLSQVGKVHADVNYLKGESKHGHTGLLMAYGNSLTQNNAMLGGEVYKAIQEGAVVYIQSQAPDWFIDVMGYAADMEEGAREDYEYERYKERQLEER